MKTFNEHWVEILENFNWSKVHQTMTALNWVWNGEEVPTIGKLISEAKRLCEEVYRQGGGVGTGGFLAEYYKKDNVMTLKFIVGEWQSEKD